MPTADIELLIGKSALVSELKRRIVRVARSMVPVLVVGETGTGKEVCASIVAGLSGRSPFVPTNCAAFPEGLVDSELFGHERGAFTGAVRDHPGLVGLANGGTLFLDELAELTLPTQAKLLRTLESGEYRPVGSRQIRHAQFRTIGAVNTDPDVLVAEGRLRADVLHRLGAIRLALPRLRDRPEDIPLLVVEFLQGIAVRETRPAPRITEAALAYLMAQPWPGNVRQLRNVVEGAVALASGEPAIEVSDLQDVLEARETLARSPRPPATLAEAVGRAEADAIAGALRAAGGNREAAARLLRISPATLYRKLSRNS